MTSGAESRWRQRQVLKKGRARPDPFQQWATRVGNAAGQTVAGVVSDPKTRKYEAIDYWDRKASRGAREGKILAPAFNWTMKQLAKAHAESRAGLALDIASLGTGALSRRAVAGGARAVGGTRAVRQATATVHSWRSFPYARAALGGKPSVATERLARLGRAAKTVRTTAPKFCEPVKVGGANIVSPRRALKALSKASTGVRTDLGPNRNLATRSRPGTSSTLGGPMPWDLPKSWMPGHGPQKSVLHR